MGPLRGKKCGPNWDQLFRNFPTLLASLSPPAHCYADRVRKITYEEGAHNIPTPIFPVFEGRCPHQWILPSLTHLVWKCDTPAGLDRGKIFLTAGLQSLTLEVGHKFSNLSNFLAMLSTRTRLDNFSKVMAHQDLLERVSIVAPGELDAKIGKWVSELPGLRSLKLDLTGQGMGNVEGFFDEIAPGSGWPTPGSEVSRDSGVFSELDFTEIKKTTVFSRSRGETRRGACPQLRQLHLTGQAGNVVTFLKQLAGHIHTLELAIEDPPEEHDWQDLCAVVCEKLSGSLRSLRIISATPLKMELPRSPGRFQDPTDRRLPLCYLTTLPRLAVLEIDLPESVVFNNSDITHLATICPSIEELRLCPQARWPPNLAPPSITLVRCLDGVILSYLLMTPV